MRDSHPFLPLEASLRFGMFVRALIHRLPPADAAPSRAPQASTSSRARRDATHRATPRGATSSASARDPTNAFARFAESLEGKLRRALAPAVVASRKTRRRSAASRSRGGDGDGAATRARAPRPPSSEDAATRTHIARGASYRPTASSAYPPDDAMATRRRTWTRVGRDVSASTTASTTTTTTTTTTTPTRETARFPPKPPQVVTARDLSESDEAAVSRARRANHAVLGGVALAAVVVLLAKRRKNDAKRRDDDDDDDADAAAAKLASEQPRALDVDGAATPPRGAKMTDSAKVTPASGVDAAAAPRPPARRAKKNLFPTRSAATANASSEVEPYESPARDDADAMMTEVVTRAERGEAEVIGDGSNLATIDVLASPPRSPSSDAIAAVVSAKRVLSRAKASRRLRQPGELRVNVLGCRVADFIARRASLDAREEAEERWRDDADALRDADVAARFALKIECDALGDGERIVRGTTRTKYLDYHDEKPGSAASIAAGKNTVTFNQGMTFALPADEKRGGSLRLKLASGCAEHAKARDDDDNLRAPRGSTSRKTLCMSGLVVREVLRAAPVTKEFALYDVDGKEAGHALLSFEWRHAPFEASEADATAAA